jgi:Anti-sigma-K factor rskA/Putative zinc-finger
MTNHNILHELIPLYALDSLEGDELHAVRTHLDSCDACLRELARYAAVASQLVPDEPAPTHGWERIASVIGNGAADIPLGRAAEVIDLEEGRPRRTRAVTMLTAIAAVAALVFAGIALAQRSLLNDLTGDSAVIAAAEQAASSPGAYVGDFLVDGFSVAQVVLTEDGRGFVVPTEYLEPLIPERTYQLWVIAANEQVISGGVLGNEPRASTFTWTGEVSGFALTREAAGGVVISEGDVVAVATQA